MNMHYGTSSSLLLVISWAATVQFSIHYFDKFERNDFCCKTHLPNMQDLLSDLVAQKRHVNTAVANSEM